MIQRIIITLVFNCDGGQNAHSNTMKQSTGFKMCNMTENSFPFLSQLVHIH